MESGSSIDGNFAGDGLWMQKVEECAGKRVTENVQETGMNGAAGPRLRPCQHRSSLRG